MEKIEQLVNTDICATLNECIKSRQYFLGIVLGKIKCSDNNFEKTDEFNRLMNELYTSSISTSLSVKRLVEKKTTVQLFCNWCNSQQLANLWNKMSKGNYCWNNIKIVWSDPNPDYYVIINAPPRNVRFNKKKTIIFQMEPNMSSNIKQWGEYSNPSEKEFLKVCKHSEEYNNNEWHLSKTWSELSTMKIDKKDNNDISTVLSAKCHDPGHVKRIDFVKYLEKNGIDIHVFGDNKWGYKNYKGSLPPYCKDDALFPYKYTFNVENHSIKNYWTEKIIDGILAECLVFYNGCYNLREFLPEDSYVYLELSNFKKDADKIRQAISDNLWEKKLPAIRKAKEKILSYFQFFPRLERIIAKLEKSLK